MCNCPTFFLFWKCLDDMSYWINLYHTVADNELNFFTISNLNYTVFVSLAHIQPTEINCVPKYTVARPFGRGTVWYFCEKSNGISVIRPMFNLVICIILTSEHRGSVTNCARAKKNPTSYKKRDISMI